MLVDAISSVSNWSLLEKVAKVREISLGIGDMAKGEKALSKRPKEDSPDSDNVEKNRPHFDVTI